jgi:hypothetical protein
MRRAQVIYCTCGALFAACLEPECYTDKEWLKDLSKYVKKGCTVDMINTENVGINWGECTCKENKNEPELF